MQPIIIKHYPAKMALSFVQPDPQNQTSCQTCPHWLHNTKSTCPNMGFCMASPMEYGMHRVYPEIHDSSAYYCPFNPENTNINQITPYIICL